MSRENKELVRRMYEAFGRGDTQAILNQLADDFEWDVPGPAPFSGHHVGREGMGAFFVKYAGAVELDQFDANEYLADGEKVVVLGRERAKVRETGATYDTDFAHVWTVRGGKVAHGQVYADTNAAGAAFGETNRERQALTGSLGITHKAFSGRGTPE